jgi:hypothetical protein
MIKLTDSNYFQIFLCLPSGGTIFKGDSKVKIEIEMLLDTESLVHLLMVCLVHTVRNVQYLWSALVLHTYVKALIPPYDAQQKLTDLSERNYRLSHLQFYLPEHPDHFIG